MYNLNNPLYWFNPIYDFASVVANSAYFIDRYLLVLADITLETAVGEICTSFMWVDSSDNTWFRLDEWHMHEYNGPPILVSGSIQMPVSIDKKNIGEQGNRRRQLDWSAPGFVLPLMSQFMYTP